VQHRLRWFEDIQRRPPEAPVHSRVIREKLGVGTSRGDRVRNNDIREKLGVGTSREEACETSFKMVWTYSTEAPRGTGS
jgi:hypothetical protein